MGKTEKITITLPIELISYADNIAQQFHISRSKAISKCLKEVAEKQLIADMAEGYTVLAQEQQQLAETAFETAKEVIPTWEHDG